MAMSKKKAQDKLFYLLSASEGTFALSSGFRGKMTIYDSDTSACGEYIIGVTGSGSVKIHTVSAATSITITKAANSLTLTASLGNKPMVTFEVIQGSVIAA